MLLTPLVTKSRLPASSESVEVPPLPIVTQFTLMSPRPSIFACFSIRRCCSTMTTVR